MTRSAGFVSVVVPVANAAGFVGSFARECLAVLRANYRDHELILVDDASADDTAGVIAAMLPGNAELRLVRLARRYGPDVAFVAGLDTLVASIAFGAALKLWPALLVLPLLGVGRRGTRVAAGFGITGGGLALASLLIGGWERLVSPLTWQSNRGLQIESVPATPLMWLRAASEGRGWTVGLSRYNAYEISGPGAQFALQVQRLQP